MDNLQPNELRILRMGLIALDAAARSDEPHVSFTPEFRDLLAKVNKAIQEDEQLTEEKRREEAEQADRSDAESA